MRRGEPAIRLIFTVLLCGLGLYFAITQQTGFLLGGDDDSSGGLPVDATGLDAVAIGVAFIAVGILNLALAIPGSRRIPVFWTGAGLMLASLLYGTVKVLLAITSLFES